MVGGMRPVGAVVGLLASLGLLACEPSAPAMPPPSIAVSGADLTVECESDGIAHVTATDLGLPEVDAPEPHTLSVHLRRVDGPRLRFPRPFPLGDTTVVWRLAAAGEVVGDEVTISVVDTTRPLLAEGETIVAEAESPDGTSISAVVANVYDACGSTSVALEPAGPYTLGATPVRMTVTDDSGNATTVDRVVVVVDTTPPTLGPFQELRVDHDGSACFVPSTPPITGSDNAHPPSALRYARAHTEGPGAPDCWHPGTHRITWTATDPAGNARSAFQQVVVEAAAPFVHMLRLESGGSVAYPGDWSNAPVTAVFLIAGVDRAATEVELTPEPDWAEWLGGRYRATYEASGVIPTMSVRLVDDFSQEVRSVTEHPGFGIDMSPPVIAAPLVELTDGGVMSNRSVLHIDRLVVSEGPPVQSALGSFLRLDGDDLVTVPAAGGQWDAFTAQAWVRTSSAGPIVSQHGRLSLAVTATGAAALTAIIDGEAASMLGGSLDPARWHHVAGTYDGTSLRLVVDGVLVAHRFVTGLVGASSVPLAIGRAPSQPAGLRGAIDEVRLDDSATSVAELARQYRGGAGLALEGAGSLLSLSFEGADQVVHNAGQWQDGYLGSTPAEEPDDPARAVRTRVPKGSGISSIDATLVAPGGTASVPLVELAPPADGTPLVFGPRTVVVDGCADQGAPCATGTSTLGAESIRRWAGSGAYSLEIRAVDVAGNETRHTISLLIRDRASATLAGPLASAHAAIASAIDPAAPDAAGLEAAAELVMLASGALTSTTAHREVAYQRLSDAVLIPQAARFAAALSGFVLDDLEAVTETLAAGLPADDRTISGLLQAGLTLARTRHSQGQFADAAREAARLASMMHLLEPPSVQVRSSRRAVEARWADNLAQFGAGQVALLDTMNDPQRVALAHAVAAAVLDSITAEAAVVASMTSLPGRSDRGALDAVSAAFDVMVAPAGCLTSLPNLTGTTEAFVRCELQVDHLARALDRVPHDVMPLLGPRTVVATAMEALRSLQLYYLPAGLPWSASPTTQLALALPDAVAASVPGSTALSTVDEADGLLVQVYLRAAVAAIRLSSADLDFIWQRLLADRCVKVAIFNRFFSNARATPAPWTYTHPPITDAGCP